MRRRAGARTTGSRSAPARCRRGSRWPAPTPVGRRRRASRRCRRPRCGDERARPGVVATGTNPWALRVLRGTAARIRPRRTATRRGRAAAPWGVGSLPPCRVGTGRAWGGGATVVVAVVAALTAGCIFAIGSVLQQSAAREAPPEESLSLRLLVDLAHRPKWLAGIGCDVASFGLQALALGFGP